MCKVLEEVDDRMSYYDTHAHYHHKKLRNKLQNLLPQMQNAGIQKIVEVPITLDSNWEVQQLKKDVEAMGYPDVFRYAVGVHPNHISWEAYKDDLVEEMLVQCIMKDMDFVAAVGETGLDYYRCEDATELERQEVWFRKQIELAIGFQLPLILHVRDAHERALRILEEYHKEHPYMSGVCHCFDGDYALAKQYIDKGFLLGIGGVVTRVDLVDLRECVRQIDLQHILLETDAPYLKPEGVKGKVNTSMNLEVICKCIAELKGLDCKEVERATGENACRLFEK